MERVTTSLSRRKYNTKVQHESTSRKFSINIWAGILRDHLLGPYLLPERLNDAQYLVFLQHVLRDLLQGMPTPMSQNTWFMYESTPTYFSIMVRNHLDARYPAGGLGAAGMFLCLHVLRTTIAWISFSGTSEITCL